jgi:hypothetical protein
MLATCYVPDMEQRSYPVGLKCLEDPVGLEATYAGFLHVQLWGTMFRIIIS